MLIYDNEYETKENKNWTKDRIKLQQISSLTEDESSAFAPKTMQRSSTRFVMAPFYLFSLRMNFNCFYSRNAEKMFRFC